MAGTEGNKFWLMRSSHGRSPKFKNEDVLWNAACEYFEWVEDNPLYESKAFSTATGVVQEPMAKIRAMTLDGLCLFLDISDQTWRNYRQRDGFVGVTSKIDAVIRDQKFTGAAAGLLNANIIARDLGLKDANTSEISGKNGGPIDMTWKVEVKD